MPSLGTLKTILAAGSNVSIDAREYGINAIIGLLDTPGELGVLTVTYAGYINREDLCWLAGAGGTKIRFEF
jgi:hypothetical protein